MAMKIVVSAFYFAGLVLLCCLILSLATTEHALCFVAYLIVPSVTYTFNSRFNSSYVCSLVLLFDY